ncbi:uncharacterized protein LOC131313503 isoform X3 [Rhododendron vialii]|uniref:uncharacterized protein LOC131313503 isoform X3 n=1 Tax=Rhododendron vialii TaxID=182163 RepID=UPI00265F7EEC|nr:uncharacterized protein LOC131313503 isoform X3 [Rhododendron vialii]
MLAVRPVKMASSSHRRGNYHPSSSSDDDIALLAGMFLLLDTSSSSEEEREILRRPQRTFPISGQEYTTLLLNGDPDTMRYTLRVDAHTFRTLVNLLVKRGRLKWDCMRLSVEESLAIFLYICGHGKRHRCAANRFKRSMNTIARHFKYMMRALGNIAYLVIRPPDLNEIPFEILHDKIYYPWFENCVGAIGGTYIKGGSMYAEKVMAACSFDEKFTFVYAGWESWASDSQILEAAVNPLFKFPHPPANKYYLVDAGYTNMLGYLAPYHQKDDLNGVTTAYHSSTDLFNHKHSSLRNVIERCFGVLKARFRILKAMPKYKTACQPKIVVACCVVHNWVLMQQGRDEFFKQIEEEVGYRKFLDMHIDMTCEAMASTRNEIASAMWEAYVNWN